MVSHQYGQCEVCGDLAFQEVFKILDKWNCIPCAIRFILDRLK